MELPKSIFIEKDGSTPTVHGFVTLVRTENVGDCVEYVRKDTGGWHDVRDGLPPCMDGEEVSNQVLVQTDDCQGDRHSVRQGVAWVRYRGNDTTRWETFDTSIEGCVDLIIAWRELPDRYERED